MVELVVAGDLGGELRVCAGGQRPRSERRRGSRPAGTQSGRIAAVRQAAEAADVPLFINARTDLFLKEKDREKHASLIAEAKERGAAYAAAGASGFFVPGLMDPALIGAVCEAAALPVNTMMLPGAPPAADQAAAGVARISYGPVPYFTAMKDLAERFGEATGGA